MRGSKPLRRALFRYSKANSNNTGTMCPCSVQNGNANGVLSLSFSKSLVELHGRGFHSVPIFSILTTSTGSLDPVNKGIQGQGLSRMYRHRHPNWFHFRAIGNATNTNTNTFIKDEELFRLPVAGDANDAATAHPTSVLSTATAEVTTAPGAISKSTSKSTWSLALAYTELAKARLTSLVVATTAAGYVAAGPESFVSASHSSDAGTIALVSVLIGTALCSSSAAAWNQILEVQRDSKMKRTLQRPLVTGVITQSQAIGAATLWGTAGTALLWCGTDPLTTVLGVSNVILYAGVYTALKPISPLNTWVGAVVGAIPPVMGYTAAMAVANTGCGAAAAAAGGSWCSKLLPVLDPVAVSLGSILYLWQLPHFMALSFMYRVDYTRGGFAMMPCHTITGAASADLAEERTANVIVRYAWYLGLVPFVTTAANVTSSMFAFEGILLNAYAISVAHRFHRDRTNQNARTIFLTSLWYLPCTLMLFLLHSKPWDEKKNPSTTTCSTKAEIEGVTVEKTEENVFFQFIVKQIYSMRDKGRELCVHEQAALHGNSSSPAKPASQACPIVAGKEKGKETVRQATQQLSDVPASADRLIAAVAQTSAGPHRDDEYSVVSKK